MWVAVFPPIRGSAPHIPPRYACSEDMGSAIFRQSHSLGPTHPVERDQELGRETLRTGGKILTDISKNTSPNVIAEDIIPKYVGDAVSKHVTEPTNGLVSKLRGTVIKLLRRETTPGRGSKKPRETTKRERVRKIDTFH